MSVAPTSAAPIHRIDLGEANWDAPLQNLSLSQGAQDWLGGLRNYVNDNRAKGYLTSGQLSTSDEGGLAQILENMARTNASYQDMVGLGHQFKTNAGKLAKVKQNPTASLYSYAGDPTQYRLINQRGADQVAYSGTGLEALDKIYAMAGDLSQSQGKKAHWKVEQFDPATGTWNQRADDDPKNNTFAKIASIVGPVAGALLAGPLGLGALGLGSVGTTAAGAALGSAAGGVASGKSLESILKNAALSGGLSYLGGSALGGLGGGSGSSLATTINNEALANLAAINGAGSLGSAASNALGGLGSAAFDGITVLGDKAANILGGAAGQVAAGAGAAGAAAAAGGGGGNPNDIVVEGVKPAGVNLGDVALGGAAVGLPATAAVTGSGTPSSKSTTDKIVEGLRAAGLLTGFIGDLFGGGSSSNGGRGNWTRGQLNPVFSAQLPAPQASFATRTPRVMPNQDWTKYGMQPEQSFWSDVEQRYTPPVASFIPDDDPYVPSTAAGPTGLRVTQGYASGGRADDQIARVSEGEYIIDAETVALLGDGSNEAGAQKLDDLRVNIRKAKGRNLSKGKISPNAKAPEAYMKGRK